MTPSSCSKTSLGYVEQGMAPVQAAFQGAAEIGFTVLSMSISLVAVFIPLLLMGGIVGRLFREFAVTLSIAIGVSLVVSLTTTPTMCAKFLATGDRGEAQSLLPRRASGSSKGSWRLYQRPELGSARTSRSTLIVTICVGVPQRLSLHHRAQGIFPAAGYRPHHGRAVQAAQDISFQAMRDKMRQFRQHRDERSGRAIRLWASPAGTRRPNQGRFFIMLKPLKQRGTCKSNISGKLPLRHCRRRHQPPAR